MKKRFIALVVYIIFAFVYNPTPEITITPGLCVPIMCVSGFPININLSSDKEIKDNIIIVSQIFENGEVEYNSEQVYQTKAELKSGKYDLKVKIKEPSSYQWFADPIRTINLKLGIPTKIDLKYPDS